MTTTQAITRFDTADSAAGGTSRPFAKAVRAGDFVFVSGQVPAIDGEIISGGIVQQAEQVIANIVDVLKLADCTLADVVKVNIWLRLIDRSKSAHNFQQVKQHSPTQAIVPQTKKPLSQYTAVR